MAQDRYVNLVFQGGGVRGIAYAGVLDAIPSYCKIHAVGGTSAGAIVAALLAIGIHGQDLKKILESRDLFNLLEEAQVARMDRFKAFYTEAQQFLNGSSSNRILMALRLWRFIQRRRSIFDDIQVVLKERGLYRSDRIRQWLNHILQGKRFEEIKVDDLKIVAADVTEQRYIIYDKRRNLDLPIADAVHASISIPIIFSPFIHGTRRLVDGAILSNFPSFLFAQGQFPTIGFRLADIVLQEPAGSSFAYLKSLLLTMMEAHDKERGNPPHFKTYTISTPTSIPATKFALDERDIEELYQRGFLVGQTVEWNLYSSPTPVVSFYDPKPHEALEFSLSQAHQLYQKHTDRELWIQLLDDEAEFTVYIEQDWSTRYDRLSNIEVEGEKPLFMARLLIETTAEVGLGHQSLADIHHVCEEITTLGQQELIRIPAFNSENQKGFVVFYIPPITAGQGRRKFRAGFRIPQEFAKTVARGLPDFVSYSTRQRAHTHRLKTKFRILVDTNLPGLNFTPEDFNGTVVPKEVEFDQGTRRSYQVYECDIPQTNVINEIGFKISINLLKPNAKPPLGQR